MYLIKGLHGKLVMQAGCKGVLVLRHSIFNKLLQNAVTLLPIAGLPADVHDSLSGRLSPQSKEVTCKQTTWPNQDQHTTEQ